MQDEEFYQAYLTLLLLIFVIFRFIDLAMLLAAL